jgi:APA family basic amino acid/polyamine antiporter
VVFGALAGLTSVILVMMLAQSRIFYSMSRDGLLPPRFRACHPEWRTPVFSTVLTGVGAGLMGGLLPLNVLGELVSAGTLMAFVTVCIGIMVLRVTKPELPRPFRVKWVWFVGIGGTLFCGLMLASLFMTGGTWYRIIGWTIIGFLVYFGYGYRHSALRNGSASRPIGPATTQFSK